MAAWLLLPQFVWVLGMLCYQKAHFSASFFFLPVLHVQSPGATGIPVSNCPGSLLELSQLPLFIHSGTGLLSSLSFAQEHSPSSLPGAAFPSTSPGGLTILSWSTLPPISQSTLPYPLEHSSSPSLGAFLPLTPWSTLSSSSPEHCPSICCPLYR